LELFSSDPNGPRHRSGTQNLDQADRHIAQVKQHIANQRRMITKLRLAQQPTDMARSMLEVLEGSLRIFECHRQLILGNLSAGERGGGT
jgi:hypothetical protein